MHPEESLAKGKWMTGRLLSAQVKKAAQHLTGKSGKAGRNSM